MAILNVQLIGDKQQLSTPVFKVDFDRRYAEKAYVTLCNFYNTKITGEIIDELESSKIVKVDPDFTSYSETINASSILLVPQFGFSYENLHAILDNLLRRLEDEYQEQFNKSE